jgi:Alr-MurF fusion protein
MILLPPRPTYCVIDLSAIQYNLHRMQEITQTQVMAVVKANAYGHGAVTVGRTAIEAGASWLGVAVANEGLELRQGGVGGNVLALGYTPPHMAGEVIENNVSMAVYDLEIAKAYAEAGRAKGQRARLHVKVDSGMGRLGVDVAEAVELVMAIASLDGAVVEGLFTHFATADDADQTYTREQLARFTNVIEGLKGEGIRPEVIHAANSPAALTLPEARFDLVRTGIAIYGLNPSNEVPVPSDFRPALEWKSTVSQVKVLPKGSPVSYGREYVTKGTETIAVIPVGYGDGFRRYPKNVSRVLVGGQQVPVVGRVCMDQIMANVSDVPGVKIGDEVVLVGKQGNASITADEVAARWGTINYDVVTGIMARVPRVYKG